MAPDAATPELPARNASIVVPRPATSRRAGCTEERTPAPAAPAFSLRAGITPGLAGRKLQLRVEDSFDSITPLTTARDPGFVPISRSLS